jgi:cell division septum initiation protein DivIVA
MADHHEQLQAERNQLKKHVEELLEGIQRLRSASPLWRAYVSTQLSETADRIRKELGE